MDKDQVKNLEKETAKLFNKHGFKIPKRVLPNIIFDWMTPEYCFKVRMRTILSEMKTNKNFEITEEGSIITNNNERPILLIDNNQSSRKAHTINSRDISNYTLINEIKEYLKKQNLDLSKI